MSDEEMKLKDSPPSSPQAQSDSDASVSSGEGGVLHGQTAPVKCRWSSCGEWFSQLDLLASHVTHVHAVPGKGGLFYCGWEGCSRGDRGFNARYKMLVHVRTHTNEKPHHCFQCDKSFSRAENLKIHARSHTGERPYVCPVVGCGKAYSNSSDRFKHTRTHSVDKPYVCKVPGCPKRYTDPSSLRKHVKTYRHFPNQDSSTPVCKDKEREGLVVSGMVTGLERVEVGSPGDHQDSILSRLEGPRLLSHLDLPMETTKLEEPRYTHPTSSPPFPFWPGFFQWYQWGVKGDPPYYCSQSDPQETPLDLTVPHAVKLHHKV